MLTLPKTTLRPGERVCCAISGGADSTALLLLLHAANGLAKGGLGVGLSAVHVNHGLRGEEAVRDGEFVVKVCDSLGISLHLHGVDTVKRTVSHGETTEEAARNLRYGIFRELIVSGAAEVVVTGHTLDDQAETVLMKLLRGAWTEGLGGISPEVTVPGGRVVRPLLGVRRGELREFLRERRQDWREDASNEDEAFTRNRIRHSVLPILRAENPSIDRMLANLAEVAREEEARWQRELARMLPGMILPGRPVRGGGRSNSTAPEERTLAMELERLRGLDPAMRRRVVRAAAREVGARFSFEETERVLELAAAGKVGRLKLGGGLVVERSVRELRLTVGGL